MGFERCCNTVITLIMLAFALLAIDAIFQISAAAEARPTFFNVTAALMLVPGVLLLGWLKNGLAIR